MINIIEKSNTILSFNYFKSNDTIPPVDTCIRFICAQICAYDNH